MAKLLQIRIKDEVMEELDRKCEEYGMSRRSLLELLIEKGEIRVEITDQEKSNYVSFE